MKKHIKLKNKILILNKKSLYLSILTIIIIGIIFGIIFFFKININDKLLVKNNISTYFNYINNSNFSYLLSFKNSLFNNLILFIGIWLLGISIIGIPFILFINFIKGFSLGFSITTIIAKYGAKGIVGTILYLLPDKIIRLILLFLISFISIYFSYKLILYLFLKKKIDLHELMQKYLKILIFFIIFALVLSILETFVTPFVLKVFTFLIK